MQKREKLRIGSMCSGYGGLDMGVSLVVGGSVVWNADPDPTASAILARNYPETPNHGDLRAFDWSRAETVDILTAGFPCQPLSFAGRRKGITDDRWLFDDIMHAVSSMGTLPRMLVFENVRGLLSANNGRAMARVAHEMARLGYVGRYRVVRASDAGAPHRRERVFIVGTLADSASEFMPGGFFTGNRGGQPPKPTPDSGSALADSEGIGRGEGRPGAAWEPRRPPAAGGSSETRCREWGKYADAVARWERILGRPAPPPTEPNRYGRPSLSAKFTEWMMGLPDGWVSDVPGLSRARKIHALGNGVVPQQAALAISGLLF